jgi:hypothetical protein
MHVHNQANSDRLIIGLLYQDRDIYRMNALAALRTLI